MMMGTGSAVSPLWAYARRSVTQGGGGWRSRASMMRTMISGRGVGRPVVGIADRSSSTARLTTPPPAVGIPTLLLLGQEAGGAAGPLPALTSTLMLAPGHVGAVPALPFPPAAVSANGGIASASRPSLRGRSYTVGSVAKVPLQSAPPPPPPPPLLPLPAFSHPHHAPTDMVMDTRLSTTRPLASTMPEDRRASIKAWVMEMDMAAKKKDDKKKKKKDDKKKKDPPKKKDDKSKKKDDKSKKKDDNSKKKKGDKSPPKKKEDPKKKGTKKKK
ncbi:hypothetical protein CBR_g3245 [Chara braunii]|uniref:Uncharacterized protein n=1 Tax=Chara braunii TaxID=69332 RepID=A0A388KFH4_CHABU|nr:hypothetical protein CBR_g3245 [Chara braunii]|eukprot:GBG68703.1 hypothetical protein CBR_g3245 [Chara braunii]